ncbi:MAG: inositol monophosphatase family protein [Bacteroidota bacterium]|nr:inositol monophosphatase family protein [Bacteroidota bacterium]
MDLSSLTTQTISVVKNVGQFIRNERINFDASKIETKGYNNLVSYVDKKAEIMLVEQLHKLLPEAGFIGEEDASTIGKKEVNWILDPLDGTTNYLHGFPLYAVNVALMAKEDVWVGVTYLPESDQCYYAWKNGGAWLNGSKIFVSQNTAISKSLLMQGFPYKMGTKENAYYELLKEVNNTAHGFRHTGSAAIDMAMVASGVADAYFEYAVFIWDIGPGILIVKEAGGFISDFRNGNGFWDASEIVAAGNVHDELIALISKYWK